MSGTVYLVGAGPGDPGLITVRGRELLESADVVFHDRLGTEGLMGHVRADARLVDVGKAPGRVAMSQDEINAALVEAAEGADVVVRLKGGDPFVFGRGSEEAQALARAAVAFEVVPGVTSAIAAPAYAGVPVTHRGVSTTLTIVTGHEDPDKASEQTDWAALSRVPGTLAILMGMGRLRQIASALIAGGRDPSEPAIVVQWGTLSRQRSVSATLETIADRVEREGVGSPAVVVVGPTASLSDEIGWFASRPLIGRRVVVTRASAQASALSGRLRVLGAEPIELPSIRIEPIARPSGLVEAVAGIDRYRLIVLTSVNGVDLLFDALRSAGKDARALSPSTMTVAIGPGTAARLSAHGVDADVVPERFVAEGVLEALRGRDLAGARALLARAQEARMALPEGLRELGVEVDEIHLYRTIPEPIRAEAVSEALSADYVTFTASSTVRSFVSALDSVQRAELADGPRLVSIGPVTSSTLRDEGLPVHLEAGEHTIPGLVEALLLDVAASD
jgi:uroporphyrinogen III methyltransferase/synthase